MDSQIKDCATGAPLENATGALIKTIDNNAIGAFGGYDCATSAPLENATGASADKRCQGAAKPLILLCATGFGELLIEVYPVAQRSQPPAKLPPRKVAPSVGAVAKAPLATPLYAYAGVRREQATPTDYHGNVEVRGAAQ